MENQRMERKVRERPMKLSPGVGRILILSVLALFGLFAAVSPALAIVVGPPPPTPKPDKPDKPYYDAYVKLLSLEAVATYLTWPDADGDTPCGVFDVNGHGPKVALLSDFPGCAGVAPPAVFTVQCLTESGVWSGQEIFDTYLTPDGTELRFTSGQHGICGIFVK
jgi:hypothetical protein